MSMTFGEMSALRERKERIEDMLEKVLPRLMGDYLELDCFLKRGGRYSEELLDTFVQDVFAYYQGIEAEKYIYGDLSREESLQYSDELAGKDRNQACEIWHAAGKTYELPAWYKDFLYCAIIASCATKGLIQKKPSLSTLYGYLSAASGVSKPCTQEEIATIIETEASFSIPSDSNIATTMIYANLSDGMYFGGLYPETAALYAGFEGKEVPASSFIAEMDALYVLSTQKSVSTLHTKAQKDLAKKANAKAAGLEGEGSEGEEEPDIFDDPTFMDGLERIDTSEVAYNLELLRLWRKRVPFLKLFEEHYKALRAAWLSPAEAPTVAGLNKAPGEPSVDTEQVKDAIRFTLSDYGFIELADREAYFKAYQALSNAVKRPDLPAVRRAKQDNRLASRFE